MATLQTLRDPTGRWLVDRVYDKTDVDYRIWYQGTLAAEVSSRDDLIEWLKRYGVDASTLKPPRGVAFEPWAKL